MLVVSCSFCRIHRFYSSIDTFSKCWNAFEKKLFTVSINGGHFQNLCLCALSILVALLSFWCYLKIHGALCAAWRSTPCFLYLHRRFIKICHWSLHLVGLFCSSSSSNSKSNSPCGQLFIFDPLKSSKSWFQIRDLMEIISLQLHT